MTSTPCEGGRRGTLPRVVVLRGKPGEFRRQVGADGTVLIWVDTAQSFRSTRSAPHQAQRLEHVHDRPTEPPPTSGLTTDKRA